MSRRGLLLLLGLGTLAVLAALLLLLDAPASGDGPGAVAARRDGAPRTADAPAPGPSEPRDAEPLAVPGAAAPAASPAHADHAPQEAPPAPRVTLRGRAVDPEGVAIPGARVTYVPARHDAQHFDGATPDLARLPSALADAGGRFALELPWYGGEQRARSGWPRGPDLILAHDDFAITAAPCVGLGPEGVDLGDLRMERGGRLTGRVLDEHGAPFPGVRVGTLVRAVRLPDDRVPYRGAVEFALHAVSDAAGRFRSPVLPPGGAILEIEQPGYVRLWLTSVDGLPELTPPVGGSLDVGDLRLDRGLALSGVVVDADGAPVPDAAVRVATRDLAEAFAGGMPPDTLPWEWQAAADELAGAEAASDAFGRFSVRGLAPGAVAVYARADGFLVGKQAGLAAGSDAARVVLPRGGTLELALVDATTGEPVTGAELSVHRLAFNQSYDMQLEVHDRGAGLHAAAPAGPSEHLLSVRPPASHADGLARLLGVEPGTTRRVTVHVPRGGEIHGRVIDETGAPLPEVSVSVWSADVAGGPYGLEAPAERAGTTSLFAPEREVHSDSSGRFRLPRIAPGALELQIASGDTRRPKVDRVVQLGEAETLDLGDILLALGGTAEIRTVDGEGTPIPSVQVWLEGVTASGSVTQHGQSTDDEGIARYTRVTPGEWIVRTERSDDVRLVVTPGETARLDLVLRAPPVLFGRVTRNGLPVAQARVFAAEDRQLPIWGSMIAARTAHTDADGRYTLTLPAAEAFRVHLTSPAGTRLRERVDLAWDERRRLDLTIPAAGLRGTVARDDTGAPIANALIEARPASAAGRFQSSSTHSDASGAWRLDELAPGPVALRVFAEGCALLEAGPFDTADDTPVELRLQPEAVLHGTLTRPGVELVPDDLELRLERLDGAPLLDGSDRARTDAGAFRFERLPPGAYRLRVSAAGPHEGFDATAVLAEARADLAAGETRRLDLALPP